MKVKNIVIARTVLAFLAVLRPLTGSWAGPLKKPGYNVSYLALYDNTEITPDAVTPDFVIRAGSLVSKTTHNKLVCNNPGPLGADAGG